MPGQTDSKAAFDLVAEYTSDVVVRVGLDQKVTYISPAIRKYGYEPADLMGLDGLDLIHPDDRASFAANAAALTRGEVSEGVNRQHRMHRADGTWAWVEGNPRVVRDAAGHPVEFINVFRDVTQRREAEERAREQAELFEAAFDHAAVGKALVGLDGSFLRLNDAFCRIVQYPRAAMLKLDFQTITHPDDLDADLEQRQRLTAGEIDSYEMDKRYVRQDGSIAWVHQAVAMVCKADGAPKCYVAQVQDLSARKTAEDALRESEARFRLIAEHSSDMIVVTQLSGEITYLSPSVARTGWDADQLLGHSFGEHMEPGDAAGVSRAFGRLLKGQDPGPVRWRGRSGSTGDWIWMESRPSLIRDPVTNAPTGFVDVVRDITEQVRQEAVVAEARQAAEAAAAVKAQFLANMSHEIRTPLTSVLGYARLLAESPTLQGEAATYVERILGAGNGLLAIVNDVLDFSKLEAGKFEIRPGPTRLAKLCAETLQIFEIQAAAKGLSLQCEVDPDLMPLVLLDGDRLRQALINLLGNAVKFTETGSVTLRVQGDGDLVRIDVEDTGPGLDAEAQAVLFQRFSQIDGSMTRRHGGTGLGLAITRGVAEAMGGAVELFSTPGVGSCFRLKLPFLPATLPNEPEAEALAASIEGVRVMIVEDNPANLELTRRLLVSAGAEVSTAIDGHDAVAQLALLPVDVALMDLRMPGLDGVGALARLRAEPGPNADIPVLAFTADGDGGEGPRGFDGVIQKPIDPVGMLRRIAVAVGLQESRPEEMSRVVA